MTTVCLLTAGLGTRMGPYASSINKCLLPIDGKAIISHIIDQFPPSTRFLVAVGNKAEQVKTYIELAHPLLHVEYVEIENYADPLAGPGTTIAQCKHLLSAPFMIVACDGVYSELSSFPNDGNYIGVAPVAPEEMTAYCNLVLDDGGNIVSVHDKKMIVADHVVAATGVYFIQDHETFFEKLSGAELSTGFSALNSIKAHEHGWVDVGTYERYRRQCALSVGFDFSKQNEFLYQVNGRVIKWFSDESIAEKRVTRGSVSTCFPEIIGHGHGFYAYRYVPGKTLYETCTIEVFSKFLDWIESNLWSIKPEKQLTWKQCHDFYSSKTLARLNAFRSRHPHFSPKEINGRKMKLTIEQALSMIDWDSLLNADLEYRSRYIHGDLQFDNIIYDGDQFTLIDWRHDFGGETAVGDFYYDVCKLLGGLQINYDLIKTGSFTFSEKHDTVFYEVQQRSTKPIYESMIKRRFGNARVFNTIIALIYLSMAGLHETPFDKLLFCAALEKLNEGCDLF